MKEKTGKKVTMSKIFLTDRGHLFSENDLKSYELPQTKQIEKELQFATDVVKTPFNLEQLMEWLHLSVVHSSCVHTKVQDAFGVGYDLKDVEVTDEKEAPSQDEYDVLEEFFKKVNEEEDIISLCKKVGIDYEACGNGYIEVSRGDLAEAGVFNPKGIRAMYHVPAHTIRLCKDKKRWVQNVAGKNVYFKRFGDENILNKNTGNFVQVVDPENAANELIQLKQYTHKSAFYGLPDWLPSLFTMFMEMKEKEYNLDFFTNYGVPAYCAILEGGEMDADAKAELQKFFESELKGNPHRTMVFETPQGVTLRFEKLNVDQKDASFRILRRDNRDDMLTAHHVPPYRASIIVSGQLGGSVAEDTDRIYLDSVVNPRQREFCWVINRLILQNGFGVTDIEFEFKDIDIRDNKRAADIDQMYFNMGARTPNEMLIAQGKEPYEGGDMYYVAGGLIPIGVSNKPLFTPEMKTLDPNAIVPPAIEGIQTDDAGNLIALTEPKVDGVLTDTQGNIHTGGAAPTAGSGVGAGAEVTVDAAGNLKRAKDAKRKAKRKAIEESDYRS